MWDMVQALATPPSNDVCSYCMYTVSGRLDPRSEAPAQVQFWWTYSDES